MRYTWLIILSPLHSIRARGAQQTGRGGHREATAFGRAPAHHHYRGAHRPPEEDRAIECGRGVAGLDVLSVLLLFSSSTVPQGGRRAVCHFISCLSMVTSNGVTVQPAKITIQQQLLLLLASRPSAKPRTSNRCYPVFFPLPMVSRDRTWPAMLPTHPRSLVIADDMLTWLKWKRGVIFTTTTQNCLQGGSGWSWQTRLWRR